MSRYIKKGIKDPRFANPYRYILSQIQGTQYDIIPYKGAMGDSTAQPINESNMADIEDALVAIDTDLAFVEADYINAAEHALKQNIDEATLTTTSKTIPGAINELQLDKQEKTDNALTTTNKTVVGAINELKTNKQEKNDTGLHTVNKTVVGGINEIFDDYIDHDEYNLKQSITDNSLNTVDKTVPGSINEVKEEAELRDAVQTDAIAIINNKVNALPMNGSLKNIQSSSVGIPTSFTNVDMFNTKQTVANYQPLSLDYKGASEPHIIVMKTIGDYIFDFSIEASHTNSTDTTITIEAWVDGVLYDTATRQLAGTNNQINGFTGFFSYSKGSDEVPSEIYIRYKASQGNTTSAKAMINTNLQGNSATQSFTDTDHVTGISMTNAAYNGQTSSFIMNDLDATRLKKSGDTMTGNLNMGNKSINNINGLSLSEGYLNIGTFQDTTYGTGNAQFFYDGNNTKLVLQAKDATNVGVPVMLNVAGNVEANMITSGGSSLADRFIANVHNHFAEGEASIDVQNGDIKGLNCLIFNDSCDPGGTEGLFFPKTGTTTDSKVYSEYDSVYALDGKAFLNTEQMVTLKPRLAAGTDLNNVQEPGMYYSPANADNCLNVPIAGTAFSLLVEKHAGVKQTWTSYIGGTGTPRTYVRNFYQSWGNWFEMAYTPTMSLSGEDYSQTDFPANLKLVAENLWAGGFFGGGTYSFISYGEAHETNGRLQQSFNNYMDTQTATWDNSWYTTTAQIMYTVTIPKFGNPDGSEFNVTVTDLNSTHKYNFVCEGDDPAIIKAALTTNEKGETRDVTVFEHSFSLDATNDVGRFFTPEPLEIGWSAELCLWGSMGTAGTSRQSHPPVSVYDGTETSMVWIGRQSMFNYGDKTNVLYSYNDEGSMYPCTSLQGSFIGVANFTSSSHGVFATNTFDDVDSVHVSACVGGKGTWKSETGDKGLTIIRVLRDASMPGTLWGSIKVWDKYGERVPLDIQATPSLLEGPQVETPNVAPEIDQPDRIK